MIKMIVRPNDGPNVPTPNAKPRNVRIQNLGYVLISLDFCSTLDNGYCAGSIIFPIAPYTKIKDDMTMAVRYQEAVYRSFDTIEPLDFWFPEKVGV